LYLRSAFMRFCRSAAATRAAQTSRNIAASMHRNTTGVRRCARADIGACLMPTAPPLSIPSDHRRRARLRPSELRGVLGRCVTHRALSLISKPRAASHSAAAQGAPAVHISRSCFALLRSRSRIFDSDLPQITGERASFAAALNRHAITWRQSAGRAGTICDNP